ncbi:hypothetical protein Tco_0459721 [Tanacetum coccineum]
MMSPGESIVASFEYVESFFAMHTPPVISIPQHLNKKGYPRKLSLTFLKNCFSVGRTYLDNEIHRMVFSKICKQWGTSTRKSNDSKSFERKCFRDFLVLEFFLMRVLKSGKMIGGPDF